MRARSLLAAVTIFAVSLSAADVRWVLDQSTLTYHVSHPLHQANGVSREARGTGKCQAGQCDFAITVPVKSFDSGNGSRDQHMLKVTREAQFPSISVRTQVPETTAQSSAVLADLEIDFAGQTAHYKQVPFQLVAQGKSVRISGTIPATLADFKIDPPKLLTIALRNEMPVKVEMTWHSE